MPMSARLPVSCLSHVVSKRLDVFRSRLLLLYLGVGRFMLGEYDFRRPEPIWTGRRPSLQVCQYFLGTGYRLGESLSQALQLWGVYEGILVGLVLTVLCTYLLWTST